MNASEPSVGVTTTLGDVLADAAIADVVASFSRTMPGAVRGFYVAGSYAEQKVVTSSDRYAESEHHPVSVQRGRGTAGWDHGRKCASRTVHESQNRATLRLKNQVLIRSAGG